MAPENLSKMLTKRVQEIALNGEDIPQVYYHSSTYDREDLTINSPIPVIDLGLLSPSAAGTKEGEEELKKLKSALIEWGCFQAIGHGVPSLLTDRYLKVGREFFALPMDEKNKYAKPLNQYEGYGSDPVPDEGQVLDWIDRIYINVFPEEIRDYKFWPKNPPALCEVMVGYGLEIKRLTEVTSKAMARSLNLEENIFLKEIGEKHEYHASVNLYPACPRPDSILGVKSHTDASVYTMLLQDEVALQVLKDDKWFTVPMNPDSILILMGDQMEIMSNGIFKSPEHRVLTRSDIDRTSIVMFYLPEKGKEVGPVEGLVNENKSKVYTAVKDYVGFYTDHYNKGEKAIDLARVKLT